MKLRAFCHLAAVATLLAATALACASKHGTPAPLPALSVESSSGAVRRIDVGAGTTLQLGAAAIAHPRTVQVMPGGGSLLVAGTDGVSFLSTANLAKGPSSPLAAPGGAFALADGRTVVIAGADKVTLADGATLASIVDVGLPGNTQSLTVTPDGRRALFAQDGPALAILDIASRAFLHPIPLCQGGGCTHTAAVVSSVDSRTAFVATVEDNSIWKVDLAQRTAGVYMRLPKPVAGLAVRPDGRSLVVATGADVLLLNPDTGATLGRYTTQETLGPGLALTKAGTVALVPAASSGAIYAIDLDLHSLVASARFAGTSSLVAADYPYPTDQIVRLCSRAVELTALEIETAEHTCTQCHTLDRVLQRRQGPEEWAKIIDLMMSLGLQIDDPTRATVESYLGKALCP